MIKVDYWKQINPEVILKDIMRYYDEDHQHLKNNPDFYQKLSNLSNRLSKVKWVWFCKILIFVVYMMIMKI